MISLTWLLTNAGPNLARTVHLTGQLDGITFSSVSSSQGTCGQADGIVTCDLDNLPAGASATVTILGSVNRTGTITNRATVTSLELDLNFGDNVAQQVSSVLAVSPPVSNPNALSIAAVGPANPYPSTIQVAGLT